MADDMILKTHSSANKYDNQIKVEGENTILKPYIKLEDDEEPCDDSNGQSLSNNLYPIKSESGSPTPQESSRKRPYAEIEDSEHPSLIGERNHLEANNHRDTDSNLTMFRRWIWPRSVSTPIDNAQQTSIPGDGRIDHTLHPNGAHEFQEAVERYQSEAEASRQQLTETREDLASKQDKIKSLEQTKHNLEKDLENEKKAKAQLEIWNNEYQEQSGELKVRICEVENDLATETNNHNALKENYYKFNEEYEHAKKVSRIIVGINEEHVEKHKTLKDDYKDLLHKHVELQTRAEDIAKEKTEIKSRSEEIAQRYTELEKYATQARQQLGIERKQTAQLQGQVAELKSDFAASQHTKNQTPDAQIAQLMSGLSSEIADYILNSGSDVKTVSIAASACAIDCVSANARNLAAQGQVELTHVFCCVVWQHILKLFMTQNYFGGISRGPSIFKSASQLVGALGLNGCDMRHSEKDWLRKTTGLIQSCEDGDLKAEQEAFKKRIGTEIEKSLTSIAGIRHSKGQKDALKSILDNALSLVHILWKQDDPYHISMSLSSRGQLPFHRFDPSSMEDINAYGDAERMNGCLLDVVVTPILTKRIINKRNNASEVVTIVKAKVLSTAIEKLHQLRENGD